VFLKKQIKKNNLPEIKILKCFITKLPMLVPPPKSSWGDKK
jgi:hypothetical protein